MFELKIVAISKSEVIMGLVIDNGEVEVKEENWMKFTRIRLGFIFLTIDMTWFSK